MVLHAPARMSAGPRTQHSAGSSRAHSTGRYWWWRRRTPGKLKRPSCTQLLLVRLLLVLPVLRLLVLVLHVLLAPMLLAILLLVHIGHFQMVASSKLAFFLYKSTRAAPFIGAIVGFAAGLSPAALQGKGGCQ